jgi:small-conductance mechanosensitive channel
MENIQNILSYSLFTINDQTITVGQLLLVPIILLLGYFITNKFTKVLVNKLVEKKFDQDLVLLIERLIIIVMMLLVSIVALSLLNVSLTAFAFVSGALAIGIGFGAQNILNNFISGWILMWERPIRIGDFLEIGGVKGTVERINTRSTRIKRVDGVRLLIPNSQLLESTVVNWTLIDKLVRGTIRVGVAYGSPVKKVAELIEKVATENPDILKQPAPLVVFEDFGDSSLVFDLYFWIEAVAERDLRVIKSNLRFTIDESFFQNGIVIAFPQRDVHIDGELRISR